MNQTLRQKLLELLDVYYDDNTPDDEISKDITRRGKMDSKKVIESIFLIIKEVDVLKEAIEVLSKNRD